MKDRLEIIFGYLLRKTATCNSLLMISSYISLIGLVLLTNISEVTNIQNYIKQINLNKLLDFVIKDKETDKLLNIIMYNLF